MKGSTTSWTSPRGDFSLSRRAPRLLRLRMKRNKIRRSNRRMTPPKAPPMIAPRFCFPLVEELVEPRWDVELEESAEPLDGTLEEMIEPVGISLLRGTLLDAVFVDVCVPFALVVEFVVLPVPDVPDDGEMLVEGVEEVGVP